MTQASNLGTIFAGAKILPTGTQLDQLKQYQDMVLSWNAKINLISASTVANFPQRHLLDSAQLAQFLPTTPATVLDVGSGAGLPGMVLAIFYPQHKFTLAERIQKKASFLISAAHKIGLKNVQVHAGDFKNLAPGFYDIITARAVMELAELLGSTATLLKPDGRWLLLKGEAVEREINGLKTPLLTLDQLTISKHPSIVSPAGCVLDIKRR